MDRACNGIGAARVGGVRLAQAVLPIAAVLLMSGPSWSQQAAPTAGVTPEWAAVLEAAKTEEPVVFYKTDTEEWTQYIGPAFTAATGLEAVIAPRVTAGAMIERLSAEMTAGSTEADVLNIADRAIFITHPDWFMDLDTAGLPNYAAYPANAKWKNKCVATTYGLGGFVYNADLVDPNKIPKTWTDFTDPYWKGHLVLTDPRSSPSYMAWAAVMEKAYGDEYLQALAANQFDLVNSASPGAEQVAAGAYLANLQGFASNSSALRQSGAPIKFVLATDVQIGAQSCGAILANTKSPNAAKVLLNFLMTPEAQAAGCTEVEQGSPAGDATKCTPMPAGWTGTPVDPETGQLLGVGDKETEARILKALGIE